MQALRDWVARDATATRNALLGVLAILGIILGLLAMHSFTTAAEHTSGTERAIVASSSLDEERVAPKSLGHADSLLDCSADCDDDHALSAMGCVLALLSLLLFFALPAFRARALALALSVDPAQIRAAFVPRPPSLHALSISRT